MLGLGIELIAGGEGVEGDVEAMTEKLAEIDAKVEAIRESIAKDEIIVKTWFETD